MIFHEIQQNSVLPNTKEHLALSDRKVDGSLGAVIDVLSYFSTVRLNQCSLNYIAPKPYETHEEGELY